MAINLFKLVGSIYIDSDKANESLKKTDESAEKTGNKLASAGKAAAAFGMATVAAAGKAVSAIKGQADATAAVADDIDKNSQRMGLSAEAYQKWDYALQISGSSIHSVQMGLKTMTNTLDDARNGSDKAAEKFSRLGISMDDLKAKSREEVFEITVKALQNVSDEVEKAALANDIFGRSGQEMIPMLNQSNEALDGLMKEAESLGFVMSNDAVAAGAAYTDAMTALNHSVDGVKNTIGTAAIPIFTEVAQIITSNMPLIQGMFKQLAPILADMLRELAPMVAEIMPLIIAMLPTIVDLAKTVIPPVLELSKVAIPYLIEIIDTFMPVVENLINFISNIFQGKWTDAWNNIVNVFKGIWETMKAIFTSPINWIIDKLNSFIGYVNKIKIPEWVPEVGGKGINLPEIPKLKVGIDYVPADNYPALLHKGEQVLTAEEAFAYKQGGSSAEMQELIAEIRELRIMFKNGTAKTDTTIANTRELRMTNA